MIFLLFYNSSRIRIKGPKSYEDKIGIVGAGPAGIHMATLLKEIGFKDITVFERSCRIGGKSYTINYRGAPQEMGAVYVTPDFEDNVIKLIKKYTNDTLIDEPSGSYFSRIAPGPIPFRNWLAAKAMQTFRTNNTKLAVAKLFKDIIRYESVRICISRKAFSLYFGIWTVMRNFTL